MKRRAFIMLLGSAAANAPFAARGQQPMPVIGYFHFATPAYTPTTAAFLQGLKETGYVEGQNVAIEYRWAEGQYDRLPAMSADLVDRKVDLIAAFGPPLARAAKNATSTIPIVFEVGNDAVAAGLVASLARPGGNATGLSILFTQLTPKRLELLCELVPRARTIALLVNPNSPTAEPSIRDTQEAARAKGVQLSILNASTESGIDAAFGTFRQRASRRTHYRSRSFLRYTARAIGGAGGPLQDPHDLFLARIRRGRRPYQLRKQPRRCLSPDGPIRRTNPQRREACRSAGRTAHQI
jgi:putative ABC transport system substrate-binding protein